jgi:hypothetical protein
VRVVTKAGDFSSRDAGAQASQWSQCRHANRFYGAGAAVSEEVELDSEAEAGNLG